MPIIHIAPGSVKHNLPTVIESSFNYDSLIQISIVGSIPASYLIKRYTDEDYNGSQSYIDTIGYRFYTVKKQSDDRVVEICVWDQSQSNLERHAGTDSSPRGHHIMYIAFDLTDQASFDAVDSWYEKLERYMNDNTHIVLVGTKSDEVTNRIISEAMIKEKGEKLNCHFYGYCSVKTGENVKNIFDVPVNSVLEIRRQHQKSPQQVPSRKTSGTMQYLKVLDSDVLTIDTPNALKLFGALKLSGLENSKLSDGAVASLWRTNSQRQSKPEADDALSVVYANGYPVVIVADGGYGCEPQIIHKIVTQVIPSMLVEYVPRLENSKYEERRAILMAMLKAINSELSQKFDPAFSSFTFSIAIVYSELNTGETRVSAFGTGDVTIASRKPNGEVSILKPAQRRVSKGSQYLEYLKKFSSQDFVPVMPPHQKQFLPLTKGESIDTVTAQTYYYDGVIAEGAEIFGFTDGMLELLNCRITTKSLDNDQVLLTIIPDTSIFKDDLMLQRILGGLILTRDERFNLMSAEPQEGGQLNPYQLQLKEVIPSFNHQSAMIGDDLAFVRAKVPIPNELRVILMSSVKKMTPEEFVQSYRATYSAAWLKNPWSSVKSMVDRGDKPSIDELEEYASTPPDDIVKMVMGAK